MIFENIGNISDKRDETVKIGQLPEAFTDKEKRCLYWLCHVNGVGAVTARRLYEFFGSFERIYDFEATYNIEETQQALRGQVHKSVLYHLRDARSDMEKYMEEYEGLSEMGIRFLTPFEAAYPGRLKQIYDYPMGVWIKGKLPPEEQPAAAVIGARGCTNYGKELAESIAAALSISGIAIISGLALGIDAAGHRGALQAGGGTYGVLGCGIDICYPKENWRLFEQMERKGGILSEYAPKTPPLSANFPQRNRIISGLSDVVLVMEARKRSGSLITANLALDQGRDVFALPGRVTDPLSEGCNQLIKAGAGILNSAEEIWEYLGFRKEKILTVDKNCGNALAKKEKMVYSCLDLEPKFIEQVVMESGLPITECMGVLVDLELKGLIIESSGHCYGKKL